MEPEILTEGQIDPVNEEIRSGVEQARAADAAKASAPPVPPVAEETARPSFGQSMVDAANTAIEYLGQGNARLADLAIARSKKDEIVKDLRSREFVGIGRMDVLPTDKHVAILRQNQDNPEAIAAFEWKYGEGSAQRYLRAPSPSHGTKLMENKNNPKAIDAFNAAYGGIASFYIVLNDPKSSSVDKEIAAYRLMQAYKTGRIDADSGMIAAIRSGYRKAVGEGIRAGASGVDLVTGDDAAKRIVVPENTAPKDNPILYSLVEAVSQFATGRVALGGALGGAGTGLGTVGRFLREMTVSGVVDAFAFNPDDPRLADLAKQFGLDNNWTTDKLDADWKKRLARSGEGAVIGSLLEGIAYGVRAFRARGAGNTDEAAKLSEQAKTKLQEAAGKTDTTQPSQVSPATTEVETPVSGQTLGAENEAEDTLAKIRSDPAEREAYVRMLESVQESFLKTADEGDPYAKKLADEYGARAAAVRSGLDDPALVERSALVRQSDSNTTVVQHTDAELSVRNSEQVIDDVLKEKGPAQRALDEATGNGAGALPAAVREILDRTPTFDDFSAQALRDATKPVLDDFLDVARNSDEAMDRIFSRNITMDYALKLQALLTQASKRANELAQSLRAELDAALGRQITDNVEIDSIKAQIKEVNDYVANVQKAYVPLGTASGRLLQMRQMEGPVATSFKGDIEKLRANGVSESEINGLIADSVQAADKVRLDRLNAQRKVAIAQNDLAKADALEKEITKELQKVQKEATQKLGAKIGKKMSIVTQIAKDGQVIVMKNLLSSLGTPIRGVLGTGAVRAWDNASLFVGAIRSQGLTNGVSLYKHLSKSRALGVRSGFSTVSNAYFKMLKEAATDSWKNEGKASALGYDGSKKTRNMQASNYGLTGTTEKVVDTVFSVIDKLDLPLRFTDEFISNVFNRSGVGEAAGYRFLINKNDQVNEVLSRLRDPKLTDAQKVSLKADLKKMRSGNPEIKLEDGSWVSLKEFIKKEMDGSFDDTGRFINESVADRTDYLMLKNEFSSKFGRKAEELANQPFAIPLRVLFLPFLRNPVNGFKVYMESVPGLQFVFSDIRKQLKSPDPLVRMRAEGKIILGAMIQGAAFFAAYEGYSTYVNTRDRKQRESEAASSGVGNAALKIGPYGIPMTGMDPLSGHFIMPTVIVNTILNEFHKIQDSDSKIQAAIERGEPVQEFSSLERLMKYGNAILIGSALGIGSIFLEQPTLTSMKDLVDLIPGSSNQSVDSEGDFDRQLGRLFKNQVGKLNPNLIRSFKNANDPLTYDLKTITDVFASEFGSRSALPLRYDALGRPIESKNPYRGLTGPLFPMYNRNTGTKEQYVVDMLRRMGDMTGTYTVFNGTPPDELLRKYKVDLTLIKSFVGERRVSDEFAKELAKVTPGGLPPLTERLFSLFSNEAELAKKGIGYGSYKFDGELPQRVSKIIQEHRKAAWATVLAREEAAYNQELIKEIQRARAIDKGSKMPFLDNPNPRSLEPVFPNR